MDELIYKEEIYAIIGAAIEVHKELGPGFLETVYEECMGIESGKRKIPYETQVELDIQYKGKTIQKKYIADYIGFGKIIVEFKCIHKLTNMEEALY